MNSSCRETRKDWGRHSTDKGERGTELAGKEGERGRSERILMSNSSLVSQQQEKLAKLRFDTPLVPISELTFAPTSLTEAYLRLSSLLPTSFPSSFSAPDLRTEDYFDLFRAILADLAPIWPRQEPISCVLEALGLLVDQLEDCWKEGNEAEKRCEMLKTAEIDWKHQLEMSETRCKLLFDKVQILEKDQSPVGEGKTERKVVEIEGEIEAKAGEIARLEQEIRRLTSRKVIRDMPDTETSTALQVRCLRSLRSGSITPTRKHSLSPLLLASPPIHTQGRDLDIDLQGQLGLTVNTLDTSTDLGPLSIAPQHSFSLQAEKRQGEKQEREHCCPAF